MQFDYNFSQLKKKKKKEKPEKTWTLFEPKTFKSNSDVLG